MTPAEGFCALALFLAVLTLAFAIGQTSRAQTDADLKRAREPELEALRAQVVRPNSIDVIV